MNLIDIIILAVLFVGFILGFKDGFVRKIIGLLGLAAAVYLAAKFAPSFGRTIEKLVGIEFYLSEIFAGVLIFLGVMIIVSIIKRVVHPFDKVNNLFNQILGGAVGVIQVLFFLSAVFIIMKIFNAPSKNATNGSKLYKTVYGIIPAAVDYLNSYTPKTKEFIKDYINEKDSI